MVSTPKIVIVGGGGSGSILVQSLTKLLNQGKIELIVIDPTDYVDHAPANVRAVVDPTWADFSAIPYDKLFDAKVQHVEGHAVDYDYDEQQVDVHLTTGDDVTIDYDILVHATGFEYDVLKAFKPLKTRKAEFKALARKVETAVEIAVVGAGITGVEIAGEIYGKYGGAKGVHLVASGSEIIPEAKPKLRAKLLKQLAAASVDVVYNERGVRKGSTFSSNGPLKLQSGKVLDVDLVIWSTGGSMSTRQTFPVDEQLRVIDNVFAIGDATAVNEPRTLYTASMHAAFVAKAIEAQVKGKAFKKAYKPLPSGTVFVAFGPTGGALALPFATFGAGFAKALKSKDLMLGKFYPKSLKAKLKLLPKPGKPPQDAQKPARKPRSLESESSSSAPSESASASSASSSSTSS